MLHPPLAEGTPWDTNLENVNYVKMRPLRPCILVIQFKDIYGMNVCTQILGMLPLGWFGIAFDATSSAMVLSLRLNELLHERNINTLLGTTFISYH